MTVIRPLRDFLARFIVAVLGFAGVSSAVSADASGGMGRLAQAPLESHDYRKGTGLEIRVAASGWGSARTEDVETVLHSVAAVLLENFPGRRLYPILVSYAPDRPITLIRRGPNNEYRVRLTARDRHWARYAYEFAHELAHILMNFEHRPYSQALRPNQWFEEALCEAASLYALRRLAFVWEVRPPYPQWAAYAPEFERYAERYWHESHRRLPGDLPLAQWWRQHEHDLSASPYLRNHNEVVANLLLPLFEENVQFWEAVAYLNVRAQPRTFREYLEAWHENAPEDYRDLIRYVQVLFGARPHTTTTLPAELPTTDDRSSGMAGRRGR